MPADGGRSEEKNGKSDNRKQKGPESREVKASGSVPRKFSNPPAA